MTRYKIVVSEPWDYATPAGGNTITGEIVIALTPSLIIFRSDDLLTFEQLKGRILILKPRYENEILSDGNSYKGTVDGGLFLADNYEQKDEKYLEENSKYVLIGSLGR